MDVPSEGLEILGFRWSPDGLALLLLTREKVCCCYLTDPDLVQRAEERTEESREEVVEVEQGGEEGVGVGGEGRGVGVEG